MPAVASLGEDPETSTPEEDHSPVSDTETISNSQVMTNQESEVPAVPAPVQIKSASAGMQQLEIRAIFGVDHVLDANEMIQKARNLSGIGNSSYCWWTRETSVGRFSLNYNFPWFR